jgi:nicotinate-nucleotide--dimethylbenzimidazole phosphoribosyltransferase
MLFGHQSAEYGHVRLLEELKAMPLLKLNLRLGEGSGAGAALGVIKLACRLHNEMATFAEAAVIGVMDLVDGWFASGWFSRHCRCLDRWFW